MKKIVLQLSVSLDGYTAGPDDDISWHRVDEELHLWVNGELAQMSAFLEGRRTWELMTDFWPTADEDPGASPAIRQFAEIWRTTPKIVFSRTLDRDDWRTEVRREVDPDEIRALQAEPGGDLALGGAQLAAAFFAHDLVDELRLLLTPVVVGGGRRAFPDGLPSGWELLETRTFDGGVVLLRYARAR